ncbi:helix-hairpin-helix domain-containing protein [Acholeplasma sp. OttesenSCG-928-E16]|nr:helix-hairpin-helix domain-containing protein [Acholeplasma sp. OttesenSCG-928-E16]
MKKILLLIPAIFILLSTVFYYVNYSNEEELEIIKKDTSFVLVELKGEVIFEGEYKVLKGTTVKKVVDLAYGFSEHALIDNLNLNRKIEKNESIIIARKEDDKKLKINLNKANFEDLIKVPNITEKRAAAIIVYKEQYGLFNSVEELLNVKYIGIQTYDKIKDYFFI